METAVSKNDSTTTILDVLKASKAPAQNLHHSEIKDLAELCHPYRIGGYPLVGTSLSTNVHRISINTLASLGLTFYQAWHPSNYEHLENLLNLPSFKRLLGVSQMQCLYTSQGQHHTNNRYTHSLFVAQQVYESILSANLNAQNDSRLFKIPDVDIQHCIVAGLFHDYAHGPLSHIFERVFSAFEIGTFDHDDELSTKLGKVPAFAKILKELNLSSERVIKILDKRHPELNYLHCLVKVFSDRFAYILADSFSSDFGLGLGINSITLEQAKFRHLSLLEQLEAIKDSICFRAHNSKVHIAFNENGASQLHHLFENRKDIFILYNLDPQSNLVGAILGKAIKITASEHPEPIKFANQLAQTTDSECFEKLSEGDNCYPELREMFLGRLSANVDQRFEYIFNLNYTDPNFRDELTHSDFRKALRASLKKEFRFADNEVYVIFPCAEDSLKLPFNIYHNKNGTITLEEINYRIPDSKKNFGIWIAKNAILGSTLKNIQEFVHQFVKSYKKAD